MTSLRRNTTFSVVFAISFVIGWSLVYPSESDPKNIKYVFWKIGLYRMDLDTALGTMIGDRNRKKLVVGKTKDQLRGKFGYLLPPSEACPYMQTCYANSAWKQNVTVLLLRHGPWMVKFEGDKATDLMLCKG
jgi:hypothetical protein